MCIRDRYTLAIDRQNQNLDDFYDSHHEAVLRLIRMTVETVSYTHLFADRIFHIIDGKIVKIEDNRQKIQENA